ncbi:hypothetical protein F2P81_000201 [Scophthalmus maximus]|uniref:ZZ-type zinc finger-containing protein 3 n=1 Tax=Scophthalmus maximus TaxID=52904 RepID=A0A6A4TQD0_SCOMX|nr:hypothetical protein F2P81_000201 [Scophthalmus maximus]
MERGHVRYIVALGRSGGGGWIDSHTPTERTGLKTWLRPNVQQRMYGSAHVLLQRREHQDEETVGTRRSMAASRSSRVTRSSVGLNGLDENFCGRTLRNRSIAQPEETSVSPLPRARSPKKKQDAKQQETKHESKDARQDTKQESKQESKQDARQDSKQESKQDARQDSKQDNKQESRQDVKQESKQDAKHDTKQDTKQDTRHDGQQHASLQGKETDSNASPAEVEQWTGSRKRGVSCLEKDITPEKPENCDRGKGARDASPQIKRAKRCSRSGESQGHEEHPEPPKPESPASLAEPSKDNSCEEFPGQNSADTAPASPVLRKEEGELTGAKAEDGHVECYGAPQAPNAHKASNGLAENKAEEPGALTEEPSASPTSVANCPSLLNGSQTGAPSSPDPAVPCRNSEPGQMEVSGSGESPASPAPTLEAVPEDPLPELMVAKEQEVEEVEVDVVGDTLCLAYEEQVTSSDTNGRPLTPVQEPAASTSSTTTTPNTNTSPINNGNSGETTPPLATTPSPTEPGCNPSLSSMAPSFTELYEHRYTLRTSPRRAATGGKATSSSSKPSSPPRDNGPLREEGEVEVGLEECCPVVEDPLPSDSVGPSSEELASVDPGDRAGGSVDHREAESSKDLARSQAVEEEEEEEEEEEPDVYYFESDHLALKHNKDYQRLLQTIGVLEAQRTQAILDLETLARHQREALGDPINFVEQLQKRMIRGRICHPNKSDTFNQLWTVEEQKKLEQLLVKFPPEEVESRRWQKIADELGNRTAKQVASRVQKYFIKLTKAGIPVPGRTPNLCMYTKKASNKRQHHLNKHLYRPSTFLTSYEPPVYMDEDDERSAYYGSVQDPSADDSDCPQDNSVDFCSNCSDCLFKTETHKPNHHLEPVYQAQSFLDRDYCLPQSTGYNYLDPNYFPANR